MAAVSARRHDPVMSIAAFPTRAGFGIAPGDGERIWSVGETLTAKATGERTGGHLVVLENVVPPGGGPPPHIHTHEDEFVYVLAGQVTLVTDAGEQTLGPGMCAGYPAGKRDAHHFINRGNVPASYLEIGNRIEGDKCFYPDDDLIWCDDGNGEYGAHRDGRRYEK